ncbi:hypothetical protein VTK73DRAFT_4214 [Phialemonium thermophilum]|uniref:Uncharacterized protein n=1 Tax=Phialemonium thermophilum TaxID=223376 RepID=A0ABR3VB87_9PEZI
MAPRLFVVSPSGVMASTPWLRAYWAAMVSVGQMMVRPNTCWNAFSYRASNAILLRSGTASAARGRLMLRGRSCSSGMKGRRLLVVHHVVEEAGAGDLLDRQTVRLVDVHELGEGAVGARDGPLALQTPDRGQAPRRGAVHGVRQAPLGLVLGRARVGDDGAQLVLVASEPLALLVELVSGLLGLDQLLRQRRAAAAVALQPLAQLGDLALEPRDRVLDRPDLFLRVQAVGLLVAQGQVELRDLLAEERIALGLGPKLRAAGLLGQEALPAGLGRVELLLDLGFLRLLALVLGADAREFGLRRLDLAAHAPELLVVLALGLFPGVPRLVEALRLQLGLGLRLGGVAAVLLELAALDGQELHLLLQLVQGALHLGDGLLAGLEGFAVLVGRAGAVVAQLFDLAQLLGDGLLLLVVVGVLEAAALPVLLLEAAQLLLLLLQLAQAVLDVGQQLVDLLALVVGLGHDLERLGAARLVHARARDLLEQVQPLRLLHVRQRRHAPLRHDVVRVRLGEAGRLQQLDDVLLGDDSLVVRVLVLLQADGPPDGHLLAAADEAAVRVVEDDLDVGRQDGGARALASLRTKRMAAKKLLLPEPFRPTMTFVPGEKGSKMV